MIENECCEWGPCLYTPVYYLFHSIRTSESYGKDPMEILFQGASEATLIPWKRRRVSSILKSLKAKGVPTQTHSLIRLFT